MERESFAGRASHFQGLDALLDSEAFLRVFLGLQLVAECFRSRRGHNAGRTAHLKLHGAGTMAVRRGLAGILYPFEPGKIPFQFGHSKASGPDLGYELRAFMVQIRNRPKVQRAGIIAGRCGSRHLALSPLSKFPIPSAPCSGHVMKARHSPVRL